MGEAKRRGNYEERKALAIQEDLRKKELEREAQWEIKKAQLRNERLEAEQELLLKARRLRPRGKSMIPLLVAAALATTTEIK